MINLSLADRATGKDLHICETTYGSLLVTSNLAQAHGTFKSETRSAAGTSIITEPDPGHSIILTDLIISSDRVNAATFTVRFTDGTNTVNIFSGDVTDAPINLASPLSGRWQGWKDARVELVTVGLVTVTVSCGYYKVDTGLDYAEWDSLR